VLNTTGLDLASTPPFAVPMGFFMAAPPLAITAGLLLALNPDPALLSRWSPAALAATHLLLLGFVSSIMCGSLLQVLPVLVGTRPVTRPLGAAALAAALAVGSMVLAMGFAASSSGLLLAGGGLAAASLLLFALRVGLALLLAVTASGLRAILLAAAAALAVTAILGTLLVAGRLGIVAALADKAWTDLHLAWGLAGWMGLLLIGIASELLPMFYLAPAPPRPLQQLLAAGTAVVLLGLSLTVLRHDHGPYAAALSAATWALLNGFVVTLFISQWRRRRVRRDPSLGFWWLGQASILAASLAWFADAPATLVGVLLIVGAGMSFTTGTLFKIVPFLSWYHLQARKVARQRTDVRLPTMQGFIGEVRARWQLALHGSALGLLLAGAWGQVPAGRFGGLLLAVSALLLWATLIRAGHKYRQIQRRLAHDGGSATLS
jgi:hypothetical protein